MAVAWILDHRHQRHLCMLVSKLTRHFQRDVGAEAPAADQVGTTGMNGSNRVHVASGDLGQAFRCVLSVHCVRLHRVKWTVRIHVVGEVVVAQHVASVRVNTEEWGLRTLWPHRYQGRGALRSALRLAPPTDAFGEQPDAREPEHVLDRDLTLELITQLAVQLNGQKRMASQIEEVVVATDMADPQQILPRSRDSL